MARKKNTPVKIYGESLGGTHRKQQQEAASQTESQTQNNESQTLCERPAIDLQSETETQTHQTYLQTLHSNIDKKAICPIQ